MKSTRSRPLLRRKRLLRRPSPHLTTILTARTFLRSRRSLPPNLPQRRARACSTTRAPMRTKRSQSRRSDNHALPLARNARGFGTIRARRKSHPRRKKRNQQRRRKHQRLRLKSSRLIRPSSCQGAREPWDRSRRQRRLRNPRKRQSPRKSRTHSAVTATTSSAAKLNRRSPNRRVSLRTRLRVTGKAKTICSVHRRRRNPLRKRRRQRIRSPTPMTTFSDPPSPRRKRRTKRRRHLTRLRVTGKAKTICSAHRRRRNPLRKRRTKRRRH